VLRRALPRWVHTLQLSGHHALVRLVHVEWNVRRALFTLAEKAFRQPFELRDRTVLLKVYDDSIAAGGTIQESVQYGVYAIYSSGSAYITENDNVLEIAPGVTYTINCEDSGRNTISR
jgi:hypothetical protein